MVIHATRDDFVAFAAQATSEQEERWRSMHRIPDANDRAALDARIRLRWEDLQEHAFEQERRRLNAIGERFPRKALAAARTANLEASAIAQLRNWAERTPAGIAILAGPPGTGKTTAAAWWALHQPAFAPEFMRATELAAASRFDKEVRARWARAQGLVLDDVGAEYADAKGSFRVDLDELVDVLYGAERLLVITTNLTRDDFRARYGERVVDRLREVGTWITVVGPSMRGQR
jgi:DNA replication protein DnaC